MMIEKVATAILAMTPAGYGMTQAEANGYARAAIKAMREPTQEMQQVVAAQWGRRTWAQYDEVIDAALKETQP